MDRPIELFVGGNPLDFIQSTAVVFVIDGEEVGETFSCTIPKAGDSIDLTLKNGRQIHARIARIEWDVLECANSFGARIYLNSHSGNSRVNPKTPKPRNAMNLTSLELGVLQELVWGAIESLQTDGVDTSDNPVFVGYCNLYAKLGGTPPAPTEPKLSPAARESAISLANELIDILRNGGMQDDRA